MSVWIALAMFVCYGLGRTAEEIASDEGVRPGARLLVGAPFTIGAWLILSTQVELYL